MELIYFNTSIGIIRDSDPQTLWTCNTLWAILWAILRESDCIMEIVVNAFYLITNFVCEFLLYAVIDGAVKFLQNTRLPLVNFR